MRWIRDIEPDSKIGRLFRTALLITLFGNIFLAVIKFAAALQSGSSAIYADAINSISDVLYSILLIIGLRLSQRPPDISHPQGHSRYEPFAALIVTIAMAYAGIEALRTSVERFIEGGAAIEVGWSAVILVVSVITKLLMFFFVNKIALQVSSPGLDATARDNLSDVFTSLAAFLGILGSNLISPLLDPLAGIFVAFWIFRNVWFIARENLGYLTGAGADEALREKILSTVQAVEGVENIHQVITEYAGPRLVVEMHININGDHTLHRAHAISDQAIEALEKLPEVDRAYVHVEPTGQN
jgi:cation diffusion facilitator family transporter